MALSSVDMVTELLASMAPFLFTSAAILFTALVYFYTPYWSVRRIPGPPTTPLLGHLPLMSKYGADAFTILARRYGPIFRFHMGRQPLVVIADPELCKEVGIKKFKDVANRSIPSPLSGSPLHQKGLLLTRDSRWSTMRNTITSLHQPSHISSQISIMQEVVNSMSANFPNSEQEDIVISDLFFKMSTDIIGRSAFGFDFGLSKQSHTNDMDSHASDFIKQHIYSTTTLKMDVASSLSNILGFLFPILQEPFRQILKRIPRTPEWETERTNAKLTRWLDELVAKRSENPAQSKDLLTVLLNARESKKAAKEIFTSDYISALAYEHLLAGSVTTSFTISTILYLVAGCPEVEEKLIKEIDDFGPWDSVPTAQDLLHKFPYLDQVIKEAMRFYTVSPLVVRETSRQIEIGGYILPKGTFVCLANGVLAKDPNQFPEPEKFKPERFDPSCEEEKQRHPYANIPFGIGPRACIGIKFAMQELRVAIVHLYQRFIFRHSPDMEKPLAIDYGVDVNFKYGVKLRVIKRR